MNKSNKIQIVLKDYMNKEYDSEYSGSDSEYSESNYDSDSDSDYTYGSDSNSSSDDSESDDETNNNRDNRKRDRRIQDTRNNKRRKTNEIVFIFPSLNEKIESFINDQSSSKTNSNQPILECKNPLCDHKTFEEDNKPVDIPEISKIITIDELIKLGKSYHCKKNKEFNGINLRILNNLVAPLTELKHLVGMKSVKESMVNQILFFLQGFNKKSKCGICVDCVYNLPCSKNQDDMLHTVITGPPGTGKTILGNILAKVYKAMEVLSKGHFNVVSRSDLVGKYLGHTAAKTQSKIDECDGGVMFIDEAYSLGHEEGRDSFSKECLDTLNQNLTERRDFLCIIAGYKDDLEKSFFSMNDGLRRRFTFTYNMESYTPSELREIFELKIKMADWKLEDNITKKLDIFFDNNKDNFPNYGGDMETLFLNCKITHCKRVLFEKPDKRRILNMDDIESGFENYIKNRGKNDNGLYKNMYNHMFV